MKPNVHGPRQVGAQPSSGRGAGPQCVAPGAPEPIDARTLLRKAEEFCRGGKGADAVECYRKAAGIHTSQGFYRHAVAIYKNILMLAPGDMDAHRNLAWLFRELGLASDASAQYEYIIKACRIADRTDEALDALRQIASLHPGDLRIQLRLIDLAFDMNLRQEGLARLRGVAEELRNTGRIDDFLRVGERLLQEQPHNIMLARDIAKAFIVRGNGRMALARLKLCFDTSPQDTETLDLLAQAFELVGQEHKSVKLLKALAKIHSDQGRMQEAESAIRRVLDLAPEDGESLAMLSKLTGRSQCYSSIDEIPVEMVARLPTAPPSRRPRAPVTEEETLRTHMPEFVTSDELRALEFSPEKEDRQAVMDLFPVNDAKRLVNECQRLAQDTAKNLQRLVSLLPTQMSSRALLERSAEGLSHGGEILTELSLLKDALQNQNWVAELGDFDKKRPQPRHDHAAPDAPKF